MAGLRDPALGTTLKNGYVRCRYQEALDDKNAGMSDAMHFIENASGQTETHGVLGNTVMRRVVTGALGLPRGIVVQSVEAQARAVASRMPIADLQYPKKVQQLAQRYLIAQAGSGTGSLGGLFSPSG